MTVLAGLVAAGACVPADGAGASRAEKTHPAQVCENALQSEIDAGLESRTVVAGPASMVASPRLAPAPASSPARYFKLQIRLEPGTDATVRTKTRGTALTFDRSNIAPDDVYRLRDGAKRVRFSSCPDRPAVFFGAVLTTGSRTVDLEVASGGKRTPATVSVSREEATP
jgi:hypothetical protein